ncbi:Aminoglycoside N(6')-acetyltransferase type 1 [compost metagenome]|jgi:aminoglycoside 6'-N-acetyltransferase I
MRIRQANVADVDRWAAMRAALWQSDTLDEHRQEVLSALRAENPDSIVLVAVGPAGVVCGFAEASLRHEYVNGCETSPVAFIEGVYIEPEHRGSGAGRALCSALEAWGRDKGCNELASDALLENTESHAFHGAIGFEETERVVYFRKVL